MVKSDLSNLQPMKTNRNKWRHKRHCKWTSGHFKGKTRPAKKKKGRGKK